MTLMTIEDIKQFYQLRISKTKESYASIKKNIHITGTIRLVLAILTGFLIYYLWNSGWLVISVVSIIGLALFLWLIVRHNRLFRIKEYLETSFTSDENELKGIRYDFSAFDDANERMKPDHPFSFDLDIFGNNSLFRTVNRCCTLSGKEALADWFENPLNDKKEIIKRQNAIIELAEKNSLRHHFCVTGLINPSSHSDTDEINQFVHRYTPVINNPKTWKIACFLMPVFWIGFILLLSFQMLPIRILLPVILICLGIGESKLKKINKLQSVIGKKTNILSTCSSLIQIIENEECKSELLQDIKNRFVGNGIKVSAKIRQLSQLAGDLDIRFNAPGRILLNTVFLWDIRKSAAIEKWREENKDELESWINSLGQYDALCSMATFLHTHPGYVFPKLTDSYFKMEGKSLGHPLMNRDICVKNDIEIPFNPYFMIVTGANMAGKSTYLRTVGVNYLLACMGMPVCADSLTIYPASLVTSLRTSDSLADNESYFFAELKRLKMIITELQEGKELFIILDEILKGTNSVDKQKGSLALIQQFISLNTCGIIATHDLLLGNLEKEFPEYIKNKRFEAEIIDDELFFSYQLKTGIAQNMNACFLMKKMGITV